MTVEMERRGLPVAMISALPPVALELGANRVVRGVKILNGTRPAPSPKPIAIMQIINIVNADVINLVLGIVTLVLLSDDEVARYFGGA